MNNLPVQQGTNSPNLVINSHQDVNTDTSNLIINPQALAQMSQFAQMMAQSKSMVPEHMQGNIGDCLAVTMQAMQWGMNPFAVAQKTFSIKGTLGYEAQLVNAVITSRAPITGRPKFEWFGPWENILGEYKNVEAKSGKKTKVGGGWKKEDEEGLGVRVWATMVGEDEPRVLELLLVQAGVRNSPLWSHDPKQQLAYLAIKRWARLNCPDVILGVYTPDELNDRNAQPKDITPKTKNAGASALLERVKNKATVEAPVIEHFDTTDLIETIAQAQNLDQINNIGSKIKAMSEDAGISIKDDDLKALRKTWKDKKLEIEYTNILNNVKACSTLEDIERMRGVIADKASDFTKPDIKLLNDTLDIVSEDIGAEG